MSIAIIIVVLKDRRTIKFRVPFKQIMEENRGRIQYEKSVPVAKRTGASANERSSFFQVGQEGRREKRNVERRRGGRRRGNKDQGREQPEKRGQR